MAIAFRRGNFGTNDSSNGTAGTTLSVINAGDLLIFSVSWDDPAGAINVSSVADTAGHTWTVAAPKARNATEQQSIQTWYAWNAHASTSTVTFTATFSASATYRRISVTEWRSSNGAWVTDPFDKTNNNTGNSTTPTPGSVTPSTNDQLVYGWCTCDNEVSGYGFFARREPSSGSSDTAAISYAQSSAAPITATWYQLTSGQWVAQVATFKDVLAPATASVAAVTSQSTPTVSPSSGRARIMLAGGDEILDEDLDPSVRLSESMAPAVLNDYWWPSGQPASPAQIPVSWFSRPLGMRLEKPYNHAEVSQDGGVTARADNLASIAFAKGVYPFRADLHTAVDADAENLAHWTVTYFGDPRMRSPALRLDLLYRSDDEKRFLLRLGIGRRIQITGVPSTWPTGADHLVIVGIGHEVSLSRRILRWTTQPVIGLTPGVAGPWFRWGSSFWSGSHVRPF